MLQCNVLQKKYRCLKPLFSEWFFAGYYSILFFGTVKAGFVQVEQPQVFAKVLTALPNGYIAGKHGSEWVVGNSVSVATA